jgi:LruC domain-containing protein
MLLPACRIDVRNHQPSGDNGTTIQNLKVDPSFNWATSREVTVIVPATVTGVFRITSADGSVIYHKANKSTGEEMRVQVSVPTRITEIALNGITFAVGEGECGPKNLKAAMAVPVTFGSPVTFNASSTRSHDAIALDDNRFVVTYSKGDFQPSYVRVGTKSGSGITFGPEFQIPGSGWAFYSTATHILKVDASRFLVVFKTNSSNGGVWLCGVTGNNISFLSQVSAGRGINYPSIALLDSDHFIFGYSNEGANAGYARLCTITGNTLSAGSEYNWDPFQHLNIVRIDDTHALFVYRHAGSGAIKAFVVTHSLAWLFPATPVVIEPVNSQYVSVTMLGPTKCVITYSESSTDYKAFARMCSISGTSITPWSRKQISDFHSEGHCVYAFDALSMLFLYSENNGSGYKCYYKTAALSGEFISPDPRVFLTNGYGITPDVCSLGPNQILASWRLHDQPNTGVCFLSALMIPDTDGDGVGDPDDDYPTDPTRAFDNFFPAAGDGSLGFEDLWPAKGDYDFNDVVVDYRFQTVTNAANNVVEIFARFKLQANGATLDNGFGFNLPNCDPMLTGATLNVTGYHLSRSYISLNAKGNENGQAKPTVIVWDNTSDLMPDLTNTESWKPYVDPIEIELTLTTPGHSFISSAFALTSFNPFIICNMERGKEVHLADRPPTSLVNPAYFGTLDDYSAEALNRWYKTSSNLPWAIDIPESFAWPVEKADITTAHLKFAAWAQSSGTLYPNWYQDVPGYRNDAAIYSH